MKKLGDSKAWVGKKAFLVNKACSVNKKVVVFNKTVPNILNSELKPYLESLQERVNASIGSSKQKYYYWIANTLNATQKNLFSLFVTKIIFKQSENTICTSIISRKLLNNRFQREGRAFQLFLLKTISYY